ncbi:response regulator transcription factor [Aliivibrio sifiae]|uniref:DNA-binding response regulator n=1 Tax=Aliivibrio sifiae TaxID=566293 RepID=A0A2S7X287_9GAMM|nr:response regulator [Aliivibrio sifiae]PQJ84235.1 DNA-binding response regulator [Aliivibrio sifiae]
MSELVVPVYIVDDDESVRDSLSFMLEGYDFYVVSFNDGQDFIDKIDLMKPGCVILDSRMPILRGQEVHALLNQQKSPLSVIFLTGHGDVPMAVDALKLGAVDFFQKPVDGEQLALAISKAIVASMSLYDKQESKKVFESLTEREAEILHLIVAGKRNQQIAAELFVAVRTVEVHRSSLMKKLNAETVADLVMTYAKIHV